MTQCGYASHDPGPRVNQDQEAKDEMTSKGVRDRIIVGLCGLGVEHETAGGG